MNSLPPAERERALWAVGVVCTMRGKGGYSEKQIAAKAGFESVEHMRLQLARWGLPTWLSGAPEEGRSKRKPGEGSGEYEEMPPAARAAKLFRERLRVLLEDVESLEHRYEIHQDKRFVGANVYQDPVVFFRRDPVSNREIFTAEDWRKLCERYGQDSDADEIMVREAVTQTSEGAGPSPVEPLTTLIGVYALSGGEMEPLLEALHLGSPSEEAKEAIKKRIEGRKKRDGLDGLRTVAEQLAQRVRGQPPAGSPRPSLSAVEHDAACYITHLRGQGLSTETILSKLSNHRTADGSRLTKEDVLRLGSLRLRYPEP